MRVINYTDLRLNLKNWMTVVTDDMEEVIIKRKDNKDLVLISLSEYNALKETNYLLSGNNRNHILKSLSQYKAGNVIDNELVVS